MKRLVGLTVAMDTDTVPLKTTAYVVQGSSRLASTRSKTSGGEFEGAQSSWRQRFQRDCRLQIADCRMTTQPEIAELSNV